MLPRYRPMAPRERAAEALDEAFFDLPDGRLRTALVAVLEARLPASALPANARDWLTRRGVTIDPSRRA